MVGLRHVRAVVSVQRGVLLGLVGDVALARDVVGDIHNPEQIRMVEWRLALDESRKSCGWRGRIRLTATPLEGAKICGPGISSSKSLTIHHHLSAFRPLPHLALFPSLTAFPCLSKRHQQYSTMPALKMISAERGRSRK